MLAVTQKNLEQNPIKCSIIMHHKMYCFRIFLPTTIVSYIKVPTAAGKENNMVKVADGIKIVKFPVYLAYTVHFFTPYYEFNPGDMNLDWQPSSNKKNLSFTFIIVANRKNTKLQKAGRILYMLSVVQGISMYPSKSMLG